MTSRNMETYLKIKNEARFDEDLTSERSRQAILAGYTPDIETVEPASLPQGGVHKGTDAWLKLQETMRSLWQQKVWIEHAWDLPEHDLIILYSTMEWTAHATGRTVRFPAIELLYFRDAKICKVELFFQDTKPILDTLVPNSAATSNA